MTIILDAQPSHGMEVEEAEYQVLELFSPDRVLLTAQFIQINHPHFHQVVTDVIPTSTLGRRGQREYQELSGSTYRGDNSRGTLPRGGFTIELEPNTVSTAGMCACVIYPYLLTGVTAQLSDNGINDIWCNLTR